MQCVSLLFLFYGWCCSEFLRATSLLPPPVSVTCSTSPTRVYQQQDHELRISCVWDGDVELFYSRGSGVDLEKGKADSQPPPNCNWYCDSVLLSNTKNWSGQLALHPGLPGVQPNPPWVHSPITIQCVSALCTPPSCLHYNLSIEMVRQDVHFFLLWPRTLPIFEWQTVPLGWCARLKSSTWSYHFRSQGGHPEDLLIPSNQHSEPPPFTVYPNVELHRVCTSYYRYQLSVQYPRHGIYTALLSVKHGPLISLSTDILVDSALLHVFSGRSKFLSHPHRVLTLSWSLLQLSQGIVAYKLVDRDGGAGWSHSYSYNPFALQSNFCAGPKTHHSKEKVLANIYFLTNGIIPGGLTGKLHFFNRNLVLTANGLSPVHLTLNPQKIKVGTYIFSHALGLYHSSQESSATNTTAESSSSHYIFYQQQSLSYLIVVEFGQRQQYRFSLHMYLNRREALFRALGEKGIKVHVFEGHSPDESLAYLVWFIPAQHPLLQCEWAFGLQFFDSKNRYAIQNYTYAYKDHVKNAAQFIPNLVLPFNPALYAGFVAEVNCTRIGLMSTILKTTFNVYVLKVTETKVSCLEKTCSVTQVRIQRTDPSKHVFHFAPGTNFSLAGDTRISCPGPKQTYVIWNIYKIPNITTTPDWAKPFQPPGVGKRNVTILDVPGSSLDDGLYLFNFTVKLIPMDKRGSVEESDSVYVEIGFDYLVAVISGGPYREIEPSDQWTLDGTNSFMTGAAQPADGFTFTWYCTKLETDYITLALSEEGKCRPNQGDLKWSASSNPIQIILPQTLQGNSVYYFRMMVQNGYRIGQADQVIYTRPDPAAILNVICIENCGQFVIPNERFCLSGNCLNCKTRRPVYYWSLISADSTIISFDWSSKSTTGRFNPYLCIKAFAFSSLADQAYVLSLKVIAKEVQSVEYEYFFDVHSPPRIGTCVLSPRVGVTLLTKFIIECSGFEDKNGPLTYKIIAASDQMTTSTISSLENSTLGIIVYAGHERKTPPSFLPAGDPSQDSALIIYVQVCDVLRACSQVNLKATVHYQMKNKSADVVYRELQGLVNEPTSPLTVLLVTKDYINLGYFIYMVASELNNIDASPTRQGFKEDLRQVLLNMVMEIPSAEVQEINQAVLSISQITQETTEVNQESQLLAVRKLNGISDALIRHQGKDLDSREIEILGHGVLIGLSNVLRASLLNHGNVSTDAVQETISVMEKLADLVLQGKVPGEQETKMITKDWIVHLWKDENWDISGIFSERKGCRNCFYPKLKQGDPAELPAGAAVSTVLYEFDRNPFSWLPQTADIGTSVTGYRMTCTRSNGDTIRIVPDVVEMVMARKDEDTASFALKIGPDPKLSKTTGGFSFMIQRSSSDLLIQIISKVKITFHVFVYLNISHPPIAFYSASQYGPPTPKDVNSNITDCAVKAPYIICLPKSLLWSSTQVDKRAEKQNVTIVLQTHPIVSRHTTSVVRIAVFAADCLEFDGVQNQWKEETCRLGPQTSYSKIHCICKPNNYDKITTGSQSTGLSKPGIQFMASRVHIFSNPVDFKRVEFVQPYRNFVPMWTVFSLYIFFIILAIWALRKDDRGPVRDPIIVLSDNDPFNETEYLVTIYTGSVCGAGTAAEVFIQLIGQEGTSEVHQLNNSGSRKILQRGSVDTFLLTTKEDLGDVLSLHIWHNNTGVWSAWFLSRVKVQRMGSHRHWLFICRKWLAIAQDEGIERTFKVTNPKAPLNRIDYFLIKVACDLFKDHLWLSLFARENDSVFSMFQRVACCFSILMSLLMANAVLFSSDDGEDVEEIRYWRCVVNGFQAPIFTIPLQFILITLFKYSHVTPPHLTSEPEEFYSVTSVSFSVISADVSSLKVSDQVLPSESDSTSSDTLARIQAFFEKLQRIRLCWWCKYIAWNIVFFTIMVTTFLTIFYGMYFFYKTSYEWLIACLFSAFEHIFVQQTCKTFGFAAIYTIFPKKCKSIPWVHHEEEELGDKTMTAEEMELLHNRLVQARASKQYHPLEENEIAIMRRKHQVKLHAYKYTKDIICHFIFLVLILLWSDINQTTTCFHYNQSIRNKFSLGLSEIDKTEDIYAWMRGVFLPLIHNNQTPTYISETWSKILGLPRMRQVRAKEIEKTCFKAIKLVSSYMVQTTHCHKLYGIDPEEKTNYLGSWETPTNDSVSGTPSSFLGFTYEPSSTKAWDYYSHGELYSYPVGGYTFYFFPAEPEVNSTSRLADLETNNWLDDDTWALILELTAFNPDVDLFCSISVIFELSALGCINRSLSINSYSLPMFRHQTWLQNGVLGIIIFMLIIYILDEFQMMYQKRINYFKDAANLINFGLKTMSVVVLLLRVAKFLVAKNIVHFYLHHPEQFVPFHSVSRDDVFVKQSLGLLVFFLFLKIYRYFRFMYDVRLAQRTLTVALIPLFNLSFAGCIFFWGFVSFGHVVFGQNEWHFSSIFYSFTTVLSYCAMAFRYTPFRDEKLWAGIFLTTFMFIMICIVINLAHVIYISAYKEMKELGVREPSYEADTVYLAVQKGYRILYTAVNDAPPEKETKFFNNFLYGKPTKKENLERTYKELDADQTSDTILMEHKKE